MEGVSDSIGPVKPKITPILISEWPSASAPVAIKAVAAEAIISFFIVFSLLDKLTILAETLAGELKKERCFQRYGSANTQRMCGLSNCASTLIVL